MSPIIHHRAPLTQQNKENKVENDVLETEKVVAVADNEKDKEKEEPAEVAEVKTDEPQTAETAAAPASPEEGENAENAAEQPAPPKKDKVKKKWSFRSISFGKKDKQKPAKKEKKVDEEPAVVVEEKAEEAVKEDETAAAATSSQSADKAEEVLEPAKVEAVVKSPEVVSKEPPKVEVTPVKEEEEIAPIPAAAVIAAVEPTKEKEPEAEKVEIVDPAKPEVAPTMPTTPPPSQASVFAESLTTEPEETAEKPAIDIEPVAQMVEKVLEEAAESVEAELSEKSEEFPDPPADDNSEEATTETPAENNMNGKLDSPVDEVC